jgi:D-3-phosphoglycerate dehydrogenase
MAAANKRLVYFENWVDPAGPELLAGRADIELFRLSYSTDEASNWAQMGRAHGYQIAPRTELKEPWFGTARLLERCPDLLAISSTGAGYDMIDVDACTAAGVIVCNQSGTNHEPVAEHALGFMIALAKKMQVAGNAMRRTARVDRFSYVGNDLVGKTVGIVGIGRIGTRTAALCRELFGMTVIAFDPFLTALEIAARGAMKVDLDRLLSLSDFVSVHCPRNAETFGMFGADKFRRMKATAYFINTARGGIHDEEALVIALREGWIAGAGIDVFLDEPPAPDHPLFSFDNVIVTPHIAGITAEALEAMATGAADQWKSIFDGKMPPRLVNPEAWPAYARRFMQMFGFAPGSRTGKSESGEVAGT